MPTSPSFQEPEVNHSLSAFSAGLPSPIPPPAPYPTHPVPELLALSGKNANQLFTRAVTNALARELTVDPVCSAEGTRCSWGMLRGQPREHSWAAKEHTMSPSSIFGSLLLPNLPVHRMHREHNLGGLITQAGRQATWGASTQFLGEGWSRKKVQRERGF